MLLILFICCNIYIYSLLAYIIFIGQCAAKGSISGDKTFTMLSAVVDFRIRLINFIHIHVHVHEL